MINEGIDEDELPPDEIFLVEEEDEDKLRRRSLRHRILKAVFAVLAIMSVSVTVWRPITTLVAELKMERKSASAAGPATSKTADSTIKPVSVRPVISAFVTTPDQCPAPPQDPPDQPTRVCDIPKTAVYELSPEALRVELTNVGSFRNPLTGAETVQVTMTEDSAQKFGQFSAAQVGKQIAFVRNGTVVWGPKISSAIDSKVLQLTGDLTPDQANQVARMLREDS